MSDSLEHVVLLCAYLQPHRCEIWQRLSAPLERTLDRDTCRVPGCTPIVREYLREYLAAAFDTQLRLQDIVHRHLVGVDFGSKNTRATCVLLLYRHISYVDYIMISEIERLL